MIGQENKSQQAGKQRVCPACNGTGKLKLTKSEVKCYRCRGTGQANGYNTK